VPRLALAAICAVTVLTLGALRVAHEAAPGSLVTASPPYSRPTIPPGYTTPPSPTRYPTRTAGEVLAGMASDPFVTGNYPDWDPKTLGTPIFVRAMRASDPDIWLVPELRDGTAFGVIVVTLDKDGLGAAGMRSGEIPGRDTPALLVPPVSEARAWDIAATAIPDRGAAQLVWMIVDPRSGFFVAMDQPMWRLTMRSGAVAYVTSSGQLVSATQAEALR
jgi:hypothetical protein